jgi:hypothetical protein
MMQPELYVQVRNPVECWNQHPLPSLPNLLSSPSFPHSLRWSLAPSQSTTRTWLQRFKVQPWHHSIPWQSPTFALDGPHLSWSPP